MRLRLRAKEELEAGHSKSKKDAVECHKNIAQAATPLYQATAVHSCHVHMDVRGQWADYKSPLRPSNGDMALF